MNTLVTGGNGLLGKAIDFGFKPSKSDLDILNYDNLCEYIELYNIDSVIHAAAKVGGIKANTEYVYDFFADNMIMNLNIMNACKKYKFKRALFIVSTCAFPANCELPLREQKLHDGEPHPTNFGYAYSKRMLEVGSRALVQQYHIPSICVIPCNLYGENDNYNIDNGHVIPSLIHKCYLAKNSNSNLHIWGSGNAEREFIYVKDFAKIIKMIYDEENISQPLIISPGKSYKIKEIVELIVKIMKFDGKVLYDQTKPEGILRKDSSNEQFVKYFSDFTFTEMENGLAHTIEYFVKNYNNLRK